MSFLTEICTKRHRLNPTTTILTYLDGRKFQQAGSEIHQLQTAPFGFVVDTAPDNTPAKITDYLYLGSQDCCDEKILTNYSIKNVLSIGVEAAKCENINYKYIPCLDLPETDLRGVLNESVCFIDDAVQRQENVLVHCNAGVSRSASVVIGYLILVCGYNYFDAYCIVKERRSSIRPNDGFVEQLKKLK